MSMTAAELLEAALDGTLQDDDAPTEQPDASTEGVPAAAAPEGQDGQDASTETEVAAPILSKSGAYTIPYEKLAEAREARKAAQDRIAHLEQQVAELTGAQRQNPASGPDGVGVQADHAYTLEARAEVQAVAFAQNSRDEVRLEGGDGQRCGERQQDAPAPSPDGPFRPRSRLSHGAS